MQFKTDWYREVFTEVTNEESPKGGKGKRQRLTGSREHKVKDPEVGVHVKCTRNSKIWNGH